MPDDNMSAEEWLACFGAALTRLSMQARSRGLDDLDAAVCLAIRMHDIARDRAKEHTCVSK